MTHPQIPLGWVSKTLGDCCDIISGGTPRRECPEFWDGTVPWVTPKDISDIENPIFVDPPERITELGLRKSSATLLPKGAILFSSRAPIGLVAIAGQPMATNQGFKSLVPGSCLDSEFLYYAIKRKVPEIAARGNDATFKEVSKSVMSEIEIEFPTKLDEQRRIAAVLKKVEGIRRKRDQTLALAENFLRSAFLEMFGDPASNKKRLPTIPLGEVIRVSSGNGLTAKNMTPNGIYPVYGGNGINGYHSNFMFDEPQIVIGRVGVYCGVIHVSEPKSWITDNALYVREFKKPINKTYLEWALRFANLNQYAGRAAQPLISGGRIYEVEILMPEEPQQEVFQNLVRKHSALIAKLSIDKDLSSQLFSGLSQRAFRGEL